jgi:hypothetical protein
MVDYGGPAIVMQDACAYAFAAKVRELVEPTDAVTSFGSGNVEALACRGWTLLVSRAPPSGPHYSHDSTQL